MRTSGNIFEALESRQLLAAAYPTVYEQYMVELHNWARANPSAAATKYFVAVEEGPPAYAIGLDPKQPLAINPYINDAAGKFAKWILDNDILDHWGDGIGPQGRLTNAGYTFAGSYGVSENAQLHAGQILADFKIAMDIDFGGYYRDLSVPGRWHRINLFNANMREIGVGIATGTWQQWPGYTTVVNFAYSNNCVFLTGVAYTDTSGDNFYTPGEQMPGATILAIRNSDGAQFSTTTWSSGGYSLALPNGSYTIWGSGGSLGGWVKYDNVTINGQNVKRDFRPDYVNDNVGPFPPAPPPPAPDPDPTPTPDPQPQPTWASVTAGVLNIAGTDSSDVFEITTAGGTLSVVRNGETLNFDLAGVSAIVLNAGAGNDRITLGAGVIGATINGENGNDTIVGGGGADRIDGGAGNDSIKGSGGNDTIFGGAGNDIIYGQDGDDSLDGEGGADRIWGGAGNDMIFGGTHNDSLYGEAGNDSIWGQNQDDWLDGGAGADLLTGGRGIDWVDYSSRTANLYIELSAKYSSTTGASGQSGEFDNVLNDIENINSGGGNDRIIGSSFPNIIKGNGGDDTIYGMGAADTLYGGAGNDRFYCQHSTSGYIDGGAGTDILYHHDGEILVSIERIY